MPPTAEYHPFKVSPNPRLATACERCGRVPNHSCHLSLFECVGGLREAYLEGRISAEELALKLPSGWEERSDDPDGEGSHLARVLRGYMAKFQCELCDEKQLREYVALTR